MASRSKASSAVPLFSVVFFVPFSVFAIPVPAFAVPVPAFAGRAVSGAAGAGSAGVGLAGVGLAGVGLAGVGLAGVGLAGVGSVWVGSVWVGSVWVGSVWVGAVWSVGVVWSPAVGSIGVVRPVSVVAVADVPMIRRTERRRAGSASTLSSASPMTSHCSTIAPRPEIRPPGYRHSLGGILLKQDPIIRFGPPDRPAFPSIHANPETSAQQGGNRSPL
ncbi:hypothetical protein [Actinoplanes sp. NPDC051851]|uniref:hypothetical protein n=1 Tax=Actinoplanes sp. NPDC051851 TaxID=3154753 RepID=UPI00343E5DBB